MADAYRVITSDFINVHVTTSKDDICFSEKRFPKDLKIGELKAKLELMTGANCNTMQIQVFTKDNVPICKLEDDNALLGSYPVDPGMRLHVIDSFSLRNELDFGNVEKYEMDPEVYAKKSDSVRAFLVKNKLGQYNEENIKKKEKMEQEEQATAESITIGSRCKVNVPNMPERLGCVMYSGKVDGLSGSWIGVKYDEPLGKHNGTVKGKQYFECPDKYGGFVKPQHIICGDFPPADYDLEEEI